MAQRCRLGTARGDNLRSKWEIENVRAGIGRSGEQWEHVSIAQLYTRVDWLKVRPLEAGLQNLGTLSPNQQVSEAANGAVQGYSERT